MFEKRSRFIESFALLIGTVIGAGVLGIPYVVAKSGFIFGILNILILGAIILLMNLYVGEISLRTKDNHMLAGYAGIYLGKWWKEILTLTTVFGIYGALIAYTIGEGEALSAILGGTPLIWSFIFFALFSAMLFFNLDFIARSELILAGVMVVLMILIIIFGAPHVEFENLKGYDLANAFLPYGVIFFAFVGASAIPEMRAELVKDPKKLKKAIFIGSASVILLYALFTFVVVGSTGISTTEISTIGLGQLIGQRMIFLGNLFAIFSMASSFLLLGLAMKWMLRYDYGLPWGVSWFLTWIVPLLLFSLGARSFIGVIGLTGAVAGGIEGIILVLTALYAKKRSQRKPEYSVPLNWLGAAVLIAVFVAGIAYQFLY